MALMHPSNHRPRGTMFLLFVLLACLSNKAIIVTASCSSSIAFVTTSTPAPCQKSKSIPTIAFASSSSTTESANPPSESSSSSSSNDKDDNEEEKTTLTVALTRELGKNKKIQSAIQNHPMLKMLGMKDDDLQIVEMPCIQHARGEDLDALIDLLKNGGLTTGEEYQYIVITSPEAARVLGDAIKSAGLEAEAIKAKVVAVGKATEKALKTQCNLTVDFVPSKANGETLAVELPPVVEGDVTKVLYPASAKAADTIQEGLQSRGDGAFQVTRLNTYDTVAATFDDDQHKVMMEEVDIACFGSPSAVEAWLGNVDVALGIEELPDEDRQTAGNGNVVAACIGTTTAKACLESRRWEARNIYYPKENPGMDGWADSTAQALGDAMERKFWGGGW